MSVAERIEALGGVAALAADVGGNLVDGDRAVLAAAHLACKYAPDAPDAITREAIARCAGWLAEQPRAARMSGTVGDISSSYAVGSLSALRHSGAMALLSPWKVRRGGAV